MDSYLANVLTEVASSSHCVFVTTSFRISPGGEALVVTEPPESLRIGPAIVPDDWGKRSAAPRTTAKYVFFTCRFSNC